MDQILEHDEVEMHLAHEPHVEPAQVAALRGLFEPGLMAFSTTLLLAYDFSIF